MELLQLKYFQKVARLESMTNAAKELQIAQPSLSKTISRLEEQVGVKLFERNGKRIKLNEAGRKFLERVEKCLRELDDGIKEARDIAQQQEEQVVLGTATAKLLVDMIRDYLTEEPKVKLRFLQVSDHAELLKKLGQNDIDISISSLPLHGKGICSVPLTVEKIYLAVSPDHRFAGKKEISLHEIENEPIIYYTAECGLREIVGNFYANEGLTPNISCECMTSEVICSLIDAGMGIAFLPECVLNMEYTRKLVWIPVKQPDMKRTIWISWNDESYSSKAAERFKEFAFDYFKNTRSIIDGCGK